MIYIAFAWLVVSIISIVPAGLAAWKIGLDRRLLYIVVALVGSAIGNIFGAVLTLIALPSIAENNPPIDIGTVLITIVFMAPTLSMLALSLHLSQLFVLTRKEVQNDTPNTPNT